MAYPQPEQSKSPAQRYNEKWDDVSYEELHPADLRKDSGRLQMIANIHLTPEKPTYDGVSWHIEGQLNEKMFLSLAPRGGGSSLTVFSCATALYYFSMGKCI